MHYTHTNRGLLGSYNPFYPRHICVPVPSQDLDFQHHMSWSFCLQREVMFCFVDIGWILLFKLSFHNYHKYQIYEPRSWRGVLDTTLCDKVCQWLATCRWFSLGTPVSSTNKTDLHDITEILLKVALSTVTLSLAKSMY